MKNRMKIEEEYINGDKVFCVYQHNINFDNKWTFIKAIKDKKSAERYVLNIQIMSDDKI